MAAVVAQPAGDVCSVYSSSTVSTLRGHDGFALCRWARPAVAEPGRKVIGLTHNYVAVPDTCSGTIQASALRGVAPWGASASRTRRSAADRTYDIPLRRYNGGRRAAAVATRVDDAFADTAGASWDVRERVAVEEHQREELVPVVVRDRVHTVTREVPIPKPVPRYIAVPVPHAVDKVVEVPRIVDRHVGVPLEVPREVRVDVPFPVEVRRRTDRIVEVPVTRTVPQEVVVERAVGREVRREVPVREEVLRRVDVPVVEEVAVPFADPRLHKVIRGLNAELGAAHAALSRGEHVPRHRHHHHHHHHHHRRVAAAPAQAADPQWGAAWERYGGVPATYQAADL